MRVTNRSEINLPLAVWLLHDEYDYIDLENYISVTTLMKPLKQILLPKRIPLTEQTSDVEDYISRALGHAIHDSVEKAWTKGHARAMKLLGYPKSVIDRILINPSPEALKAASDPIPVYMEQRGFKEITVAGRTFTIGGKFDMVADGELYDNKSTTAYSWLFGGKDEDYSRQGSLYRWLHDDKIFGDQIHINFIFTDWQKMQARSNPNYPQKRVASRSFNLTSVAETEAWIRAKLELLIRFWDAPEEDMPECSDKELWRSASTYKYYKDPAKTDGRSTKNFDTLLEANTHRATMGVGVVKTVPGEVKTCGYCPAFPVCKQKEKYL